MKYHIIRKVRVHGWEGTKYTYRVQRKTLFGWKNESVGVLGDRVTQVVHGFDNIEEAEAYILRQVVVQTGTRGWETV